MGDTKLAKVGITVKEPWAVGISYEVLDYVLWRVQDGGDGCGYIAKRDNIGVQPGSDDETWVKATQAGQSIYDLAVKYGHFEGTEEEFEAQYQAALAAANAAATAASETNTQIQNAEALRVSAESGRVSAETARVDAESRRVSAEQTRDNNETARTAAEAVRASSETGRVSAENGRVSAESGRVSAESARVSAENERRADFESLETDMRTAIGQADAATETAVALNEQVAGDEADRVSAEQARVSAESARASAETARASAETARETQAGNDHTRAESDHSTAASDHTTAGQDHTQAGTDHTRAEGDHTQAGADHTQAVADHTASEAATTAANTAAAAADAAREGIQDELDQKANKDGYYGGMTVGSAENLVGRGTVDAEYAGVRTSAGTADIGSGSAAIARMKGQSFVWNQLAKNGNFADGTTSWRVRSSVSDSSLSVSDNIATVTKRSNVALGLLQTSVNIPAGHKILGSFYVFAENQCRAKFGYANASSVAANIEDDVPANTWKKYAHILTAGSSGMVDISVYGDTSGSVNTEVKIKNVLCIDLTLLFGAGNEPSTVEEFDAWRKEMGLTLDYYAYNPGEVINNKAAGILTRGFNLYNPSTGKAFLPGPYSDYPHEYEICGTFSSISFTDVNGNTSVPTLTDGKFFNVDAPGELTVVGGNNTDTLVHLVWSGWRNEGEPDYAFEPYWENTLNLNLTQLTGKLNGAGNSVVVFPNGLAKIGDVQDEIVGNKAIKRIGVVDLGSLDWNRNSVSSGRYRFTNNSQKPLPYAAKGSTSIAPNALAWLYTIVSPNATYIAAKDKILSVNNITVYVVDDFYTSGADFKTAMSGVLLYYELETPQEYILDTNPDWNYRVDDFGTEQVLPSYDPSNLTAPISYDVQYAMNAVDAIRRLPDTYVERTDVKQVAGRSEKAVLSQKGVDDNYAKKVGVENDLVVGAAKALAGNQRQEKEFSTMVMDGADGIAKINEAMGKSLVWNQAVQDDLSDVVGNRATLVKTNRTVVVTSDGNAVYFGVSIPVNLIENHKYIFKALIKNVNIANQSTGTSRGFAVNGFKNSTTKYNLETGEIKVIGEGNVNRVYLYFNNTVTTQTSTNTDTFTLEDIQFFDLTQMFGAGNEPATVEEFKRLFPLPYYEYNAGEIISNKTQGLGITGFNQWDEELEDGTFDQTTGEKIASSILDRSKNSIPVFEETAYYFNRPSGGSSRLFFYDASMNLLSSSYGIGPGVFTTPGRCKYVNFAIEKTAALNGDICINLSDPNRNGTYEPYKHADLPLNLSTITGKLNGEGESVVIFPDGLRSAGTVYDSLLVDEDGYARKAVKRIGKVDLGTLTWEIITADRGEVRGLSWGLAKLFNTHLFNQVNIRGYISRFSNSDLSLYDYESTGRHNLIVNDLRFANLTATQVQSALSGSILIYELASPETYDLDEPIPMTFMAYHGGTITQTPQAPDSAPMRMNVTFAIDAVSTINGLPQNYVSKESLQAMLAAMQSAGIFSGYTMTFNATTGKYEFTFTVSNS